jgi:ketosteroid isomerase-like protein
MPRTHSITLPLAATFAAVTFMSCAQPQPAAPPDNRAADAAAVQKADEDWSKAAQTKQIDAWMGFYGDDAVLLPPNDKMATSKDAIRKGIADVLALPDLSISWQPTKAEAARSGDLAYTYGTYQLAWKGAKGKPMSEQGKYSEVWKKQADGSWKCIVDMYSSDAPAK